MSVCVAGAPCTQERFNTNRLELISKVVREIRRRAWGSLDALLFPAGFLRLTTWFGPLDACARWLALYDNEVGDVCRGAAHRLYSRSPGCLVAIGIDTNRSPDGWRGDQLIAAFNDQGPVGHARKIFPSQGDTNGEVRAPYLLFEPDFGSPERVVRLPNGEAALLSACYDAFALAELELGPTPKRRALRYLGQEHDWECLDRGEVDRLLAEFRARLQIARPTINLVAIHGFGRPGSEIYWQRHGIATASAALGGGLTVGASHFDALPSNTDRAPLAASSVPRSHLFSNPHRPARGAKPIDAFSTALAWAPTHRALVRLFEAE